MTERRIETVLEKLLNGEFGVCDATAAGLECENVENFVQAGVLTSSRGLVVRLADGSEFHLTIQQTREQPAGSIERHCISRENAIMKSAGCYQHGGTFVANCGPFRCLGYGETAEAALASLRKKVRKTLVHQEWRARVQVRAGETSNEKRDT